MVFEKQNETESVCLTSIHGVSQLEVLDGYL